MANDVRRGSFVRWQSITLSQVGYVANLIVGLSIAAIGFQINLLRTDGTHITSYCQKISFIVALVSVMFLAVSVGAGIWLIINRLRDFRAAMSEARAREIGEEDASPYRKLSTKLGGRTWRLLWWQMGTFGFGSILLVMSPLSSVVLGAVTNWNHQTKYAGLSLGMNMAQVEYVTGEPEYVSNLNGEPEQGTGAERVASADIDESTVRKHLDWQYAKPLGAGLEIEFDPNTKRLRKIACYDLKLEGKCPPLAGIPDGISQAELFDKLGPPSTHSGSEENSTVTYRQLGVFFFIMRNQVHALGVDVDAS